LERELTYSFITGYKTPDFTDLLPHFNFIGVNQLQSELKQAHILE